ncbi:MAG: hypothetical protein HY763_01395 [Planctomycetes bacterium]|nr:hypothetical protein [Planctomycetota bacterium]
MLDDPASDAVCGNGAELIDVPCGRERVWNYPAMRVVIVALAVAPATSTLLSLRGLRIPEFAYPLYGVLVAFCVLVVERAVRRRQAARWEALLAERAEVTNRDLLLGTTATLLPFRSFTQGLELARSLVRYGRVGVSLRACPAEFIGPIAPFTVPFEPELLNEAEAAETLPPPPEDAASEHATPGRHAARRGVGLRRVRRNVQLHGGWLLVALFGSIFVMEAWDSYSHDRITPGLVVATIVLTLVLTSFGGPMSVTGRDQWFLVPGGMVRRSAKPFNRRPRLHLFERATSALVLYYLAGTRWLAAVADAGDSASAMITQAETVLLLRAWLSPLPPPPVQRLSDLAAAG